MILKTNIRTGLVSTHEVKEMVLESGTLVSARELAKLRNCSIQSASANLSRWIKNHQLFAVKAKGRNYFPLYALDAANNFEPLSSIRQIIQILNIEMGCWQISFWFICGSRFLNGKSPSECILYDEELVIAAAMFELEGALHG